MGKLGTLGVMIHVTVVHWKGQAKRCPTCHVWRAVRALRAKEADR